MSPPGTRWTAATTGVLIALLSVAGCGGRGDGQVGRAAAQQDAGYVGGNGLVRTVPIAQRKPAPELSGPTLGGGSFTLSRQRGRVVVLNVWGSWCPPCRKEARGLQRVSRALAPQGVRFVGINTRDTTLGAQTFVREFGVTYPSVVDTDGARLLAFRDNLPPSAIPSTLVVDRQGRMAGRVIGAITETTLRDLVQQVASER